MTARPRKPPSRRPKSPRAKSTSIVPLAAMNRGPTEWIGGRVTLPGVEIAGHTGPVEAVVWVAGELIVDLDPLPLRAPRSALADSLVRALARANAPRPTALRVGDARDVPALTARVGAAIPVRVGPTPELDAVVAQLAHTITEGRQPPPLFELIILGDEDPVTVARFFANAAALYAAAPWDALPTDEHVLALDAPALGWNEACVCVVGQAGASYGVLVFRSAAEYTAFRASTAHDDDDADGAIRDLGGGFTAVSYEPFTDVPASLQTEFKARGWPLAGPAALPTVMVTAREGDVTPVTLDDVTRAAVLCDVLARFFAEHGAALRADETRACAGRYPVAAARGLTVGVRYPHPRYRGVAPEAHLDDEELATQRFIVAWGAEFLGRFRTESTAAFAESAFALLGRRPGSADGPALERLQTSLQATWSSLWRPMKDGVTGLQVTARGGRFAEHVHARKRLASARVLYGEVLAVDVPAGEVVVRDLFDGARLRVMGVPDAQVRNYNRWMRVFGVVLPRDDGRWSFPSLFLGSPGFAGVAPDALVTGVRDTLAALGKRVDVDVPAPHAGLLRHAGIALSVLLRLERAVVPAEPAKTFFANTDGEGVEFIDAEVAIALPVKTVEAKLRGAADFSQVDTRAWDRIDRSRVEHTPLGESVGQLAREGRTWVVRGNSPGRVDRMLDRLESLLGARPKERSRSVHPVWKTQPGAVRAPGEGVRTVVLAAGPVDASSEADAMRAAAEMPMAALRRALDRHNPGLGGVPRALVRTDAGRAAVEQWLREAEARGLPAESPDGRMLDLDPLREELGLDAVVSRETRAGVR